MAQWNRGENTEGDVLGTKRRERQGANRDGLRQRDDTGGDTAGQIAFQIVEGARIDAGFRRFAAALW